MARVFSRAGVGYVTFTSIIIISKQLDNHHVLLSLSIIPGMYMGIHMLGGAPAH
jgi:hypothetical protein